MNSHEARALLGSFFGPLLGLAGFLVLFVFVIAHLAVSAGFTDIKDCGVAEGTAILFGVFVFVSPLLMWVALIGTVALGFDDGPAPFIVAGLMLAAVVGNEVWFVASKVSARHTAAEMRRGFGGEGELSKKLFRESSFCRVYDAVL